MIGLVTLVWYTGVAELGSCICLGPPPFSGGTWPPHFKTLNFAKMALSNTISIGFSVKVNCLF